MNLVDSCGWLEYIAEGPNADFFAEALEQRAGLVVPTICICEVFRRLLEQIGESIALEAVAAMRRATVVPLTHTLAIEAAVIGRDLKLPLADSVILATAHAYNSVLWTQDADFRSIAGVRYIPKRGN